MTQPNRRSIPQLNEGIDRLRIERENLINRGLWVVGPDDLLTIIDESRWETYHSKIIAWLLNPLRKHGLGTKLLKSLLSLCNEIEYSDLTHARTEVEVFRGGTRADIVVFAPSVTLIIENKIDAKEQERQCERLYEQFSRDPGAVFIFLTPNGRPPSTANNDEWKSLKYRDLANQIDEALIDSCENIMGSGRATVRNYLVTLRREFK